MVVAEQSSDVLSLTARGQADPRAVRLARELNADRDSHAVVIHQVAKSGHLNDEELGKAETEFLQFAVLLGISEEPLAPSNVADWYWHSFILDTRRYTEWCRRHFGKYLHHSPTPWDVQEDNGTIERTKSLYRDYFGTNGYLANCKGNSHDCTGCHGDDGTA